MTNNTEIPTNVQLLPDNNFSGFVGGKDYELIFRINPHQKILQALVGQTLEERYENRQDLKEINVLDIGTGTGLTSYQILSADPRIKLTSVDNEPKMIAEAKNNLKSFLDAGRIEISKEDALEFLENTPDASMDEVATAFTIHNFDAAYREKVLKEVLRILKPGGTFINADKYVPDDPEEYKKEYDWQIQQFNDADVAEEVREGWIKHYEVDDRPEIIMKENESIELMKRIGFVDVATSNRHHLEMLLTATKG